MIKNEIELWKSLPGVTGVEVSTFGNIRTLDRAVSSESRTRFTKGRILKQYDNGRGYLIASITIDGKWTMKAVHRLIAKTFIPNPDNLPEVNHKNCDRHDNRVSNLEWCSHSYNIQYREKFGISNAEVLGHPVFAINLATMEVSRFRSQREASRVLGINSGSVNAVISGKRKQSCGYWFTNDNDNAIDIAKRKLHDAMHLLY